jgi:thiamine-monophosphate kinase
MNDTLADYGEFRLIDEVILPTLKGVSEVTALGSDAAYLPVPFGTTSLVVTTDVAPRPLAWHLGHQSYRTWGWYAALINASDLAAAGARPLGLATSVEAPASMLVGDIQEFFGGVADACRSFGLTGAGGNIRSADKFACHGCALGVVDSGSRFTRAGCVAGDLIVSIGMCGDFATAYLEATSCGVDKLDNVLRERLIRPRPKLREMQALRAADLIHAASDNSDGVLGALWNIVERSRCTIVLDFDHIPLPERLIAVAKRHGLNPWNLFLFWGDWQVIAAIPGHHASHFFDVAAKQGIDYVVLGRAENGPPMLCGIWEGCRHKLALIRNENFTEAAFNSDIRAHVDHMLRAPLVAGLDGSSEKVETS